MDSEITTNGTPVPGGKAAQRKLSALQWNCRTIAGKVPFLIDYLRDHPQADVMMLQSLSVEPKPV